MSKDTDINIINTKNRLIKVGEKVEKVIPKVGEKSAFTGKRKKIIIGSERVRGTRGRK